MSSQTPATSFAEAIMDFACIMASFRGKVLRITVDVPTFWAMRSHVLANCGRPLVLFPATHDKYMLVIGPEGYITVDHEQLP